VDKHYPIGAARDEVTRSLEVGQPLGVRGCCTLGAIRDEAQEVRKIHPVAHVFNKLYNGTYYIQLVQLLQAGGYHVLASGSGDSSEP
jgi:hypothetical protein